MTLPEWSFQAGNPQHIAMTSDWFLLLDCSSKNGTLAVLNTEYQVLTAYTWDSKVKHSEALLPHFQSILEKFPLINLKRILTLKGPGSFTGLRVAATFAKALSFSFPHGELKIESLSSFFPAALKVLTKSSFNLNKFYIHIPSIQDKTFQSCFKIIKNKTLVEEIVQTGASTLLEEHITHFSSYPLQKPISFIAPPSPHELALAFATHSHHRVDHNFYAYLDFSPMYLRKSEAEEKLGHVELFKKENS